MTNRITHADDELPTDQPADDFMPQAEASAKW
jgi:hypothetical protein